MSVIQSTITTTPQQNKKKKKALSALLVKSATRVTKSFTIKLIDDQTICDEWPHNCKPYWQLLALFHRQKEYTSMKGESEVKATASLFEQLSSSCL